MSAVAVLFARADSIYKAFPEADVYDAARDARTWPGGAPVVAHPPCRSWGTLRGLAKPAEGERDLAPLAVDLVRRWGGVLEHPAKSRLWPTLGLPQPGTRDAFGGFSVVVDQDWFGHRAEKRTLLYVVGVDPADLPPIPLRLEDPPRVLTNRRGLRAGMERYRPEVTERERDATPPAFAAWLLDLAARCAK